jgi:hypothetical protein
MRVMDAFRRNSRQSIATDEKKKLNATANHTLTTAGSYCAVVNICYMDRSSGEVGCNDELAKHTVTKRISVRLKVTSNNY